MISSLRLQVDDGVPLVVPLRVMNLIPLIL